MEKKVSGIVFPNLEDCIHYNIMHLLYSIYLKLQYLDFYILYMYYFSDEVRLILDRTK